MCYGGKNLKPYVASHLRDMNRKTVFQLISNVGEISRAEISRRTGISAPTVLKIIDYFLENDFVFEAGEGESSLGRKPQLLKFNPEAAFSIGVEFEGNFLRIGIVDLHGKIKFYKQIRISNNFDDIVENDLKFYINSIIEEAKIPKHKILGVGLGIPGVVDPENNIVEFAPLVGITDKKNYSYLVDRLSKEIGLPVLIENDANAAVIGEFVTRKLDADSDLLYVSLGTGLGAGIILNGKLRRGKRNFAGEIGYMVFDKDYITSKSKGGWMETLVNFNALQQKWGDFDKLELIQNSKEVKLSKDYYLLIDFVASNLALSIANILNILDIDKVVIGGISTEILGKPLIESVQEYLNKLCLFNVTCEFQQCSEASVIGAASIVMDMKLNELLIE